MKFGVTVVPSISDWRLFVDLEAMGYDCAWAADSQMLYSDAYATLALAAANTKKIRLGTGVSVAGVRLAGWRGVGIAAEDQAKARVDLGDDAFLEIDVDDRQSRFPIWNGFIR